MDYLWNNTVATPDQHRGNSVCPLRSEQPRSRVVAFHRHHGCREAAIPARQMCPATKHYPPDGH
jgi:hypothetical protein